LQPQSGWLSVQGARGWTFRRLFADIRAHRHDLDAGRFAFPPSLACQLCQSMTHSAGHAAAGQRRGTRGCRKELKVGRLSLTGMNAARGSVPA
jgi:hypothetical protein